MKHLIHTTARAGLAGLAGLCLLAAALASPAQEEQGPDDEGKKAPDEAELPKVPIGMEQNDLQEEMRKLFHEVERNLESIDVRLADAGAGMAPLAEVPDSGLDKLLRNAQQKGQQVVSDIDRILEIAEQLGGGTGMGQQMPGPPKGEGQSDKPQDGSPQQRERTEGAPPEGEKPGEKEQKDAQPKDGDKPDSPQGTDDPGTNKEGTPQDRNQEVPPAVVDDADRWGNLPPRAQEIFRNQGRDDVPVQYRDWIDAYYRRLNRGG